MGFAGKIIKLRLCAALHPGLLHSQTATFFSLFRGHFAGKLGDLWDPVRPLGDLWDLRNETSSLGVFGNLWDPLMILWETIRL